jgi:hypothetical protein
MSGLRLCGGIDIQIPDHDFFPALTGGCGRYGLDPIDLLK